MKILHVINNLGSGGAEKLIQETLPLINKKEEIMADVLLLTDKGNVFEKSLENDGVKIHIVPLRRPRSPLNVYYINRYITEGKYDIVHAHLFPTIYWVSIASRFILRNKPKFIYTEHSTYNRRRDKRILRPLEKWIYSIFSKIISISNDTQINLIDWLKPKKKDIYKFTVINNGINIDIFTNAKPYKKNEISYKLDSKTKLLCMVGRFSEAKDQGTIIRAMKSLSENVHLLLVGEGPLKICNEKLARDLGVDDRVCFLGFRNDVEKILKTSDIIIQSSKWEGFGLSAVEGMATGKPVITSDVSGLKEVVYGAGVLFKKGDSNQLADEINYILEDNKYYNSLAEACLSRASMFNIHIMVKNVLEIYNEVLQ